MTVNCHDGNPDGVRKEEGHAGSQRYFNFQVYGGPKAFYPDPGSAWIHGRRGRKRFEAGGLSLLSIGGFDGHGVEKEEMGLIEEF